MPTMKYLPADWVPYRQSLTLIKHHPLNHSTMALLIGNLSGPHHCAFFLSHQMHDLAQHLVYQESLVHWPPNRKNQIEILCALLYLDFCQS